MAQSEINLRRQTLALLSGSSFREPSVQEMKILEQRGYDTVLPTEKMPLWAVVYRNRRDHFHEDTLLSYGLDEEPWTGALIPPVLTVALRSGEVFYKHSFNKPLPDQLEMIEEESQRVQVLVPDARAIMLPVSTLAQLDVCSSNRTGRPLLRGNFARVLDVGPDAVFGRGGSTMFTDWPMFDRRQEGSDREPIGAIAAVVFVRNKQLVNPLKSSKAHQ